MLTETRRLLTLCDCVSMPMPARFPAVIVLALLAALPWACAKKGEVIRAQAPVVRDIPDSLRGTIGAETTFIGIEPQLVSGFGIVVGLKGTGGGLLDPAIQANMERELSRHGVGLGSSDEALRRSPSEFLRDPGVAVVIVEAAIPPGAPKGRRFDVRVRSIPGSGVTSLEGGTLWTTDLRIGPATVYSGYRTHQLGIASGPIFINPFAEPDNPGADAVTRTVGRVLSGGEVTEPLKMLLVLDNESHARARSITSSINTRFPETPQDEGPIARGRDAATIALTVPAAYRDEPEVFLRLVRHTRVDQTMPQEYALRYVEEMKRNPELAETLSWCLRAIGKPAIPFLGSLYDYPQLGPRLAALEAGAFLDDPKAVAHLLELARASPPAYRAAAIRLLGGISGNPRINVTLRECVNAPELDVRVAAYEALVKRADPLIERFLVGDDPGEPKFLLDLVPSTRPLIYITQQGEPRIVIFGGQGDRDPLKLTKPLLVSAWSDRLMVTAEDSASPARLYYRDARTGQKFTQQVPDAIAALTRFLGHRSTPEDPQEGLDFTYSEVVGALYEIHRQGGVEAAEFATERERLLAAVYEASLATRVSDRPETTGAGGQEQLLVFHPTQPGQAAAAPTTPDGKPSMVVPLNRNKPASK
jgi:hypothetical protein